MAQYVINDEVLKQLKLEQNLLNLHFEMFPVLYTKNGRCHMLSAHLLGLEQLNFSGMT